VDSLELLEKVSETARPMVGQWQQGIHRALQSRRIQSGEEAGLKGQWRIREESPEGRNEGIRVTGRSVAKEVIAGVWICRPAASSEHKGRSM
jgi:hypothetical protein